MLRPRGISWTVGATEAGQRLDKFLAGEGRVGSRSRVSDALIKGKVFLNGREASARDAGRVVRAGAVVRFWVDRPGSATMRVRRREDSGIAIVHEDEAIIVVNKPAGMLAVPLAQRPDALSVSDYLTAHLRSRGKRIPFVVHRIDRDTSGLVVFAKSARAQEDLKGQFKRHGPERVYWAIVYGHPEPPAGTWRDHLKWDAEALVQKRAHPREEKGKEAISHYRTLERLAGASLVEIRLETGKRNQIRIQARLHGHMLVGERLYVHGPETLRSIEFARQALHAARLSFTHPLTGRPLAFEVPLPTDMAALVARLRKS